MELVAAFIAGMFFCGLLSLAKDVVVTIIKSHWEAMKKELRDELTRKSN